MIKKLYLMVTPLLFLLIGVPLTIFISVHIINSFSLVYANQNDNMPFTYNKGNSQLPIITNSTILKHLGLYTIYQHLNNTISNLMSISEASMNRSNTFGNLPLSNITNEMKGLLANNKALLYVGLLLPNGDRYFGEPYFPYQTKSSITNFAYRDHFIGALETKQPYLSNAFNAVSTGEPIAILASPIYADIKNPNSLIGVQVLGLNLTYFNDLVKISMSKEEDNKRMIIVDNNGTKIADSLSDNNKMQTFQEFQSFQNAKNGKSGLLTEKVNGKDTFISYAPIKFAQTNWIILLFSSNG